MLICIDPGHNSYGVDTGAQGNGLKEQDLTLDIALKLKPLLETNGFEVVMTRTGDTVGGSIATLNDSLEVRCDIANKANADLFVSIHINAGGGAGAEVYVYGTGGNAERCARKMIYYLAQLGFYNRGVKVANFQVLRDTNMPAILTENGFIDNAGDAEKLKDPDFLYSIARAHAKGICDFYGVEYRDPEPVKPPPADKVTQTLSLLKQAIKLLEG